MDFLIISLTGDASSVLKDLDGMKVSNMKPWWPNLNSGMAFGAAKGVLHSAGRKKKKRKMGELLTDLVKDIRRLFVLVYSGQCNIMADAIAKDAFTDALWDKELTIRAMGRELKSLENAFKIADTRRRRGRVTQLELDGIQRTHCPLKEMPTATAVCQAHGFTFTLCEEGRT